MRLYFKHFARSLKAHPMQPLLIIVTVSLSVCMCLCAIGFQDLFLWRGKQIENKSSALGDIIIRLGSDSQERVLFADDAQGILGKEAIVVGDYSLTAFTYGDSRTLVRMHASELERLDSYMEFDFIEYGGFTEENLSSSVIVSEDFAVKHNISLYTSLPLEVLGEQVDYTVCAIADDEVYFEDCDIICDISSARSLLAQRAPIIATLGDDFSFSNRLLVRLSPSSDRQAALDALKNSNGFSDDYIELSGSSARMDLNVRTKTLVIFAMAIVMLLLCGMTVVGAIGFLIMKRQSEYAIFRVAGASLRQISALLLSESFVYSVVGGGVGGVLSPFAFNLAASLFPWYDGGVKISALDFLWGFLIAFTLTLGCTLVAMYKSSHNKKAVSKVYEQNKKPNFTLPLIYAVLLVICGCAAAVTPLEYIYIPALVLLVLATLFIHAVFPLIFFCASMLLERITGRRHPAFLLAQKGIKNGSAQKNIGRLLATLLSLLVTISLCIQVMQSEAERFGNIITGELIALGVPEKLKEELTELEYIDGIAELSYSNSAEIGGKYSVINIGINGNPNNCILSEMLPSQFPREKQLAISRGLAELCDVGVGERICVYDRGNSYELEVCEITDSGTNLIFTDASSIDYATDICIISLSDTRMYAEVVTHLESKGVIIADASILDMEGLDTLDAFIPLMKIIFFCALFVCGVGIFNMLSEERVMRKRERELLSLCGMSRRQIMLMRALEILSVFTLCAALSVALGYALFWIVNLGAASFGVSFI